MSFASETLASLKAAYTAKIAGGTAPDKSFTVDGFSVESMSLAEIHREIDYWQSRVERESGNVSHAVFAMSTRS